MSARSASTDLLSNLALMRLRLQEGGVLSSEDVRVVLDVVNVCDINDDGTFRHSLILLLETVCRRIWLVTEFARSSVEESYCDFADVVVQKIGGSVNSMQFNENDRWFGGVTSHPGRNSDKTRIVSILAICLALCQRTENITSTLKKTIFDSLLCFYSSSDLLALDLLNSDDRFLTTVSALLSLKRDVASSSVFSPFQVILAAFRQIRFDPKTVMAWVNSDEMGAETITAIVTGLVDDNSLWKAAAGPSSNCSPPAKRIRQHSREYDETWLVEPNSPSHDDVVVDVHVPFVDEQDGRRREVTLAFSRTAEIRKRLRSALPTAAPDDFTELEEMMVELKLMITKKYLDYERIPAKISMLYEALSRFISGLPNEDEDEEEYEEDEESD